MMPDKPYAALLVALVDRDTGEEKPALLYPVNSARLIDLADIGTNILTAGKVYKVNSHGEWVLQD